MEVTTPRFLKAIEFTCHAPLHQPGVMQQKRGTHRPSTSYTTNLRLGSVESALYPPYHLNRASSSLNTPAIHISIQVDKNPTHSDKLLHIQLQNKCVLSHLIMNPSGDLVCCLTCRSISLLALFPRHLTNKIVLVPSIE